MLTSDDDGRVLMVIAHMSHWNKQSKFISDVKSVDGILAIDVLTILLSNSREQEIRYLHFYLTFPWSMYLIVDN